MNRVLRTILIVLAGIIALMALIEFSFKAYKVISSKDWGKTGWFSKKQDTVQDDSQIYGQPPDEPDGRDELIPSYLFNNINKYLEFIAGGKHLEAYNLLYPEFKTRYFPDLKSFTDYCRKRFTGLNKDSLLMYEDYKMDENTYTCRVKFVLKLGPNDETTFEDFYTVYFMNGDKDFNLSMFGYIGTQELNYSVQTGGVSISVKKVIRHYNNAEYVIEVFNGEAVPVALVDKNSFFDEGHGESWGTRDICIFNEMGEKSIYSTEDTSGYNFIVNPNSSAQFNLPFFSLCYEKVDRLVFNSIKVGQETRKVEIELK